MLQWWIDTLGKLGPATIAILVLFTTWRQNRWQNAIGLRAAQVEDQKFRLALLERRNDAIEKVRFAVSQFWSDGTLRQDAAEAVKGALRIAELAFDDEEQAAIEAFLRMVWKQQRLNRTMTSWSGSSAPDAQDKLNKAAAEAEAAETELMDAFEPLLTRLREAARVRSVPSLPAPPTNFRSLMHLFGR